VSRFLATRIAIVNNSLARNLSSPSDVRISDVLAGDGLEIKVCVRTYRLFYVPGTEDILCRVPRAGEVETASEKLRLRQAEWKKWVERLETGESRRADAL
jgi:paired amphipathic helix protein Sin3a